MGVYQKGEANILFVLGELKNRQPNADYAHLTLVGHSNGGDTAMYFAKEHPDLVTKVVTLDNLRVPFVLNNKMKILSFRSKDPNFKTDPGVLPSAQQAVKDGIDIIKTPFQHTEMSDRGPDSVKEKIQGTLDRIPRRKQFERVVAEQHRPTACFQSAPGRPERACSAGGARRFQSTWWRSIGFLAEACAHRAGDELPKLAICRRSASRCNDGESFLKTMYIDVSEAFGPLNLIAARR